MGSGGIEKAIKVDFYENEKAAFDVSIDAVKDLTEGAESNLSQPIPHHPPHRAKEKCYEVSRGF